MGIDQLLAKVCAIFKETEYVSAVTKVNRFCLNQKSVQRVIPVFSKCMKAPNGTSAVGLNLFSRECQSQSDMRSVNWEKPCCYWCNELDHIAWNCFRNGSGGQHTIATFQSVIGGLLMISIQVDDMQCSVFIDTGCFRSRVSVNQCWAWSRQHGD